MTARDAMSALPDAGPPTRLVQTLRQIRAGSTPAAMLDQLVQAGLDVLPLPAGGATLTRWRALAAVAAHDLSLAKLYEGHTDALAILAELRAPPPPAHEPVSTWGVWAAEVPEGRTQIVAQQGETVLLGGAKCWCSGAGTVSHVLMTAWFADGRGPQLVRLALRQPGVQISSAQWHAVGMAGSASLDVRFNGATATLVGGVGSYLRRPGFWHGGAGIAACWFGGASFLANTLRQVVQNTPAATRPALRLAALGKVDVALAGTAALLREAAAWIDAHPQQDARAVALRVRLSAEATARTVLDEVGRTLGAAPFCRDAKFAQMAADLPVFVRQSHAERDFAGLAECMLAATAGPAAAVPGPAAATAGAAKRVAPATAVPGLAGSAEASGRVADGPAKSTVSSAVSSAPDGAGPFGPAGALPTPVASPSPTVSTAVHVPSAATAIMAQHAAFGPSAAAVLKTPDGPASAPMAAFATHASNAPSAAVAPVALVAVGASNASFAADAPNAPPAPDVAQAAHALHPAHAAIAASAKVPNAAPATAAAAAAAAAASTVADMAAATGPAVALTPVPTVDGWTL